MISPFSILLDHLLQSKVTSGSKMSNELDDGVLVNVLRRGVALCGYMITSLHMSITPNYAMSYQPSDTPLIMASRLGLVSFVRRLLKYGKTAFGVEYLQQFMWTPNRLNKTAFDVAVENGHAEVAKLLLENVSLESLVSKRNHEGKLLVSMLNPEHDKFILDTFDNAANAVMHPLAITSITIHEEDLQRECITYLLREEIDQKIRDEHGWTPLQYAVHHNNASATAELVDADPDIVNEIMKEDDINTFPVHIAASRGYCETLKVLMSHCPGCTELVDEKGKNILHVAFKNKKTEVIELLYRHGSYTSLVNKKDNEGNTPIHLLMDSDLEMMDLVMDSRVNINALNNEKRTPLDMASSDDKRKRLLEGIAMGQKGNDTPYKEKKMTYADAMKLVESLLIVATLIATASFAAAFTIPGGFNGNEGSEQGMPILLRKAAFKAFMISNTIAFSCSASVLYLRIWSLITSFGSDDEPIRIVAQQMSLYTLYAMYSMMVAFATGIYVVLTPYLGLAIFLCSLTILIPLYGAVTANYKLFFHFFVKRKNLFLTEQNKYQ